MKATMTTQRDLIKAVAKRWEDQYKGYFKVLGDKYITYQKLLKLDLDTCSAKDVDDAIGNSLWTTQRCDCCGSYDHDETVTVGEEPDYEASTARMCKTCAVEAVSLFSK